MGTNSIFLTEASSSLFTRIFTTTNSICRVSSHSVLENLYRASLDAEAEEIGYHYKEAGMKRKAYGYYFRAADGSAQAYSLRESNMLLEDAINLASDDFESQNYS